MDLIAKLQKTLVHFRYALFGLAVIKDIPTEEFNSILKEHLDTGWNKTYEYNGVDAWIDFGRIDVNKGKCNLEFEWNNWTGGQITGPREAIEALAQKRGLST